VTKQAQKKLAQKLNYTIVPGATIYTPRLLAVYDAAVLGFSNLFVWRCPSHLTVSFYNRHVSTRHLDVGVGTGYFLNRCRFPTSRPTLAILDASPHCLRVAGRRLRRYTPITYLADILRPFDIASTPFDSIGLNYVLHCLPVSLACKGAVLKYLSTLLAPRGVLFGTTIVGRGVRHGLLARALLSTYNARGIFTNAEDSCTDIEILLRASFSDVVTHVVGDVVFFVAVK
jgi:2-polyprenyl-3-methyl-5-hydroxy-6-metoxy-1,4-benzoquinol methylase